MSQISHMSRNGEVSWKPILTTKRSLDDTLKFVSHDELSENEKIVNESQQYEEWIYIAQMVGPPQGNHLFGNFKSEVRDMRSTFTNEQIVSMASWLAWKKNHLCNSNATTQSDIAKLNDKQRFAYEIVAHHGNSSKKKRLHLLVTRQGRSGKSFFRNSLQLLLC